ncbi:hypothetical protein [Escherichia coli]
MYRTSLPDNDAHKARSTMTAPLATETEMQHWNAEAMVTKQD